MIPSSITVFPFLFLRVLVYYFNLGWPCINLRGRSATFGLPNKTFFTFNFLRFAFFPASTICVLKLISSLWGLRMFIFLLLIALRVFLSFLWIKIRISQMSWRWWIYHFYIRVFLLFGFFLGFLQLERWCRDKQLSKTCIFYWIRNIFRNLCYFSLTVVKHFRPTNLASLDYSIRLLDNNDWNKGTVFRTQKFLVLQKVPIDFLRNA